MYVLGYIDEGGYIYTHEPRRIVHRESILPWRDQVQGYTSLSDAKEALGNKMHSYPELVISFEMGCGVNTLWCNKAERELVQKRLKIWNGCYGAWPLKEYVKKGHCPDCGEFEAACCRFLDTY